MSDIKQEGVQMPDTDTSRRFAQLEIDDYDATAGEAPAAPESARFAQLEVDAPAAPAVDPIDAFAARARAARVNGVAPRAVRQPLDPIVRERGASSGAEETRSMVDSLIAVSNADASTGAVVFWSLPGDVTIDALTAAWAVEGLDPDLLPSIPPPAVALHRAVKSQTNRNRFATEHPDGGWVLVDETRIAGDNGSRTLDYKIGLRFRLDEKGERILCSPSANVPADETQIVGRAIRAEFDKLRHGAIDSKDVSVWLVRLVSRTLDAVSLRETGGFYFVPKTTVETRHKIKRALGACSAYVLAEIPAVNSTETIAAVLDAIRRESESALTEMENELNAGALGNRGNANRIKACDALAVKVAGFEKLLGRKLADTTDRIAKLRARIQASTTRANLLEVD